MNSRYKSESVQNARTSVRSLGYSIWWVQSFSTHVEDARDQAGDCGSVVSTGDCGTYGMEKEAPGGENSQIGAAVVEGSDGVPCCKKLPGADKRNPDGLQARAVPSATIRDIKTLGEYTAKGETRFLVPAKSRKLARTRRATLPPFLADEGPGRDCSGLPHRAASSAPPRQIPPPPC